MHHPFCLFSQKATKHTRARQTDTYLQTAGGYEEKKTARENGATRSDDDDDERRLCEKEREEIVRSIRKEKKQKKKKKRSKKKKSVPTGCLSTAGNFCFCFFNEPNIECDKQDS